MRPETRRALGNTAGLAFSAAGIAYGLHLNLSGPWSWGVTLFLLVYVGLFVACVRSLRANLRARRAAVGGADSSGGRDE